MNRLEPTPVEFHALNRCLDVAIAGAVTEFQSHKDSAERKLPVESEMQNIVTGALVAFQSIKSGTVGVGGSTGRVLTGYMKKMNELLELSRTSKARL
ncbi:hypothetical protein BH10BDE1_BH10BDE1_03280 [soil metagenome]